MFLMIAILAAVFAGSPAAAERLRIIPVPPHVTAQWTPMPDVPQVFFAPNLPTDVFRHRGRYYFYWEGVWYRSNKIKGPWSRVDPPPAILSQIPPSYFKTLPKEGAQPPAAAVPGQPPDEVLLTPEGKPALPPPAEPAPPTPPAGASAPPPQAPTPPAPVTPPQPPEAVQPPEPAPPATPPESQESAPLAVPEGPMPKVM
jgi:hypothetical protein